MTITNGIGTGFDCTVFPSYIMTTNKNCTDVTKQENDPNFATSL
jgi:hypothetical protein